MCCWLTNCVLVKEPYVYGLFWQMSHVCIVPFLNWSLSWWSLALLCMRGWLKNQVVAKEPYLYDFLLAKEPCLFCVFSELISWLMESVIAVHSLLAREPCFGKIALFLWSIWAKEPCLCGIFSKLISWLMKSCIGVHALLGREPCSGKRGLFEWSLSAKKPYFGGLFWQKSHVRTM